jgi:hypothetical protein
MSLNCDIITQGMDIIQEIGIHIVINFGIYIWSMDPGGRDKYPTHVCTTECLRFRVFIVTRPSGNVEGMQVELPDFSLI